MSAPLRVLALALAAVLCAAVPARADDAPPASPRDTAAVVADLKAKEDATRLAAATEALAVEDDEVTKPLVHLLTDERFEIRIAAVRALGARTSEGGRKEAAKALAARLPKVSKSAQDEGEQAVIVQALHDLAQLGSIKALLTDVDELASDDLFRARMMAVANVPAPEAVDELIQFLARQGRGRWEGLKRYVVEALRDATGEQLGGDPDAWRAWWKDARKTFDFEAAAERRDQAHEQQDERDTRRRERKDKRKKDGGGGDG